MWNFMYNHDIINTLSNRYLAAGGGVCVEIIASFFVTVVGGVICHLIVKWLDSNKDNN